VVVLLQALLKADSEAFDAPPVATMRTGELAAIN
jgi:hypothetical protein